MAGGVERVDLIAHPLLVTITRVKFSGRLRIGDPAPKSTSTTRSFAADHAVVVPFLAWSAPFMGHHNCMIDEIDGG
jgi:hypothetical protein